jgi:hypothetical protein
MLKFNRLGVYEKHGMLACFCEDITASSASKLLKSNRNTINLYYKHFRELIVQQRFEENSQDLGVFELDEKSFGVKRVRGKRGRRAAGKTPVFDLLKREGKVFVSHCPKLLRRSVIIQGQIPEGSTVHTDGWGAYDGLVVNE